MKTKGAIEFIKSFKTNITSMDIENGDKESIEIYNNNVNEVMELLQRGEKLEKMWKDIKNVDWRIRDIAFSVNKIEQKYFPKEEL